MSEDTALDFGPSKSVDSKDEQKSDEKTTDDEGQVPKLVIAIDFGTYACGIALQWRSDYERGNGIEAIKVPARWAGVGFCTRKTPSCLLLKPDKSIAAFGYKADFMYSKNESLPKHKRPPDWNDWYYFRYYKMKLYCGENYSLEMPMEAANDKFLPMIDVLACTIQYLKDEAINMLREDGVYYSEEETKWVLTVPAIWNDQAKHVMHEAAEKAGLLGKNLTIALEPECAAIYCTKLPLDKMDVGEANSEKKPLVVPGQILTVVDMGGGTVDITTVRINEDKTMRQVAKSCGGPHGGTKVNERFEMYLQELIGRKTMQTFVEKHAIDYHDMRMDFECRKREMKDADDEIPIKLPDSLKTLWEEDKKNGIDEILEIENKTDEVEFMSGRLFLKAEVVKSFFQDVTGGILKVIKDDVLSGKEITVDALILVGGFAESSLVIEKLRQGLEKYHIPIVRPQFPELAVLNGAVLFGQNETIVASRVMRYTYGIGMSMEFVSGKHNEDEKYFENKKMMANNVFRKHVTVGQSVNIGDWIASKDYFPDNERMDKIPVYIFTSKLTDPIHTTEPGSEYVGHVDVEFPRGTSKQKSVRVEFKFGGTQLRVRAVTMTEGNKRSHIKYLKFK